MSEQTEELDVVVAFSGINGKFANARRPEFTEAIEEAGLRCRWLIDENKALFMGGCKTHPTESSLLNHMKVIRERARRMYVVGWSAGGFGAVKYGAMVGADAIISYSGILGVDDATREKDRRGEKIMEGIRATEKQNERRNVRFWLDQSGYKGPIHHYYGKDNRTDQVQADIIAQYANAHLHPQNAEQHIFLLDLKMSFKDHWKGVMQDIRATEPA